MQCLTSTRYPVAAFKKSVNGWKAFGKERLIQMKNFASNSLFAYCFYYRLLRMWGNVEALFTIILFRSIAKRYVRCLALDRRAHINKDAWLAQKLTGNAWIFQESERDSWIYKPKCDMICLQKYASPVNFSFSFHSEKTSRFPWNLEYKKRDLKFPLTNLWSMKCFVKYTWRVNLSKIMNFP